MTVKRRTMIDAWRDEIRWLTVGEAVILLQHLGGFHIDPIAIISCGFKRLPVRELLSIISDTEYCVNINPCWFSGGPTGGKRFKGTFLTMVLDRVIYTAFERGAVNVASAIRNARSLRNGTPRNEACYQQTYDESDILCSV